MKISFPVASQSSPIVIGSLVRHLARGVKFWVVISISNGVALAKPAPVQASGCC